MAALMVLLAVAWQAKAYVWDGRDFDEYKLKKYKTGFVEEYSNADEFCHSFILPPGFSLMNNILLAVIYFFGLCYLFLGIAIISDIFME